MGFALNCRWTSICEFIRYSRVKRNKISYKLVYGHFKAFKFYRCWNKRNWQKYCDRVFIYSPYQNRWDFDWANLLFSGGKPSHLIWLEISNLANGYQLHIGMRTPKTHVQIRLTNSYVVNMIFLHYLVHSFFSLTHGRNGDSFLQWRLSLEYFAYPQP